MDPDGAPQAPQEPQEGKCVKCNKPCEKHETGKLVGKYKTLCPEHNSRKLELKRQRNAKRANVSNKRSRAEGVTAEAVQNSGAQWRNMVR